MADAPKNGGATLQRWLTIGAIAFGLLAPIVGGGWWLSNLNGRVSNLERTVPDDAASLREQTADLRSRFEKMDGRVQGVLLTEADTCQQLAKIETQFGITETIINKDNIDTQRHMDSVNSKLFGTTPSGIYYEIKIPHEVMGCQH